jgi:monoamine oxidase
VATADIPTEMEQRKSSFQTNLRKSLSNEERAVSVTNDENWKNCRNKIIKLWLKSPVNSLSWDIVKGLDGYNVNLLWSVYCFLCTHSHINMGVCKPISFTPNTQKPFHLIVVGAGVSGLATARQLQNMWPLLARDGPCTPLKITILESSSRIGGRVCTIPLKSYKDVAVDLGAQMVTGFEDGNPLEIIIRRQLGLRVQYLLQDCPLIDVKRGTQISKEADQRAESIFNEILARATEIGETSKEQGTDASLGQTIFMLLSLHRDYPKLTDQELRAFQWHVANLEFANGALINDLSLAHWDQDDENEFRGPHATIKGGFGQVPHALAFGAQSASPQDILGNSRSFSIKLNSPVVGLKWKEGVVVTPTETLHADAVVLTTSLGVLKQKSIQFEPELPHWKSDTIQRMGFGFFKYVFW